MRLIVTNGTQAVDITVKGAGTKALRRASAIASKLMRQNAKQARTQQPFGFAIRSDTHLADTGDE